MVRIPIAARLPLLNATLAVGLTTGAALLAFNGEYAVKVHSNFEAEAEFHSAALAWWLFTAVIAAGLLVQHRWPLPAFALVIAGAAGHQFDSRISAPLIDYAVPIVLYTLASLARNRWVPAVALLLSMAGNYGIGLYNQVYPIEGPPPDKVAALVPARLTDLLLSNADKSFELLLVMVLAVALGEVARARRARLAAVEQRAADLEREQQQRAALAMAAERARITRELHDVVAHGLSVMVVQAQGAAAALHRHPERTAAALQEVITVGRGSLAEMRRLLGVVRRDPAEDAGAAELTPQPGVAVLPALVDQVRAVGMPVRLVVHGEPVALPAGVDLSAYRIVQEALSNAMRHAPGAAVQVHLHYGEAALVIEVRNDSCTPRTQALWEQPGEPVPSDGGGHGIIGMHERATMLGGHLEARPTPNGEFLVTAALPLGSDQEGAP